MLVVKGGIVVQSLGFSRYLPVGNPAIAMEFLNQWGVDEIILLDIDATRSGRPPDFGMVRNASIRCHVPLTVGGGISSIDHIKQLMHSGADKIAFNQAALHQPDLLTDAARMFGDQCVVASIDSIQTETGQRAYDYRQRQTLRQTPAELATQLQALGAGEILINSVDRDGSRRGFDIGLVDSVSAAVSVPVICCGGAGCARHFVDVFRHTRVSAAAAANFFHFTEHSVTTIKAQILSEIPVRHDTHADYAGSSFDDTGRLLKKDDRALDEMLFVRIEKEVI